MLRLVWIGAIGMTASAAFAGELTQVSFEDLKHKCADFLANDQMQPQYATISCNELAYEWRQTTPTQTELANQRSVGARVVLKRFEAANRFFPFTMPSTQVQCINLVKVERRIDNVEVTLSCKDLLQIDDLGSFCEPHVSAAAQEDPDLVAERTTSETINICPGG